MVQLHRDPRFGGVEHLLELPPWIRPKKYGLYWHQPRSAVVLEDGRISIIQWCGPHRTVDSVDALTWLAPSELRCGTCIGRRLGFDRADGAIFQPRDAWSLPKWCPGEGGPGWPAFCVLCGGLVRASTSWHRGEARHRPEPALARWEPCPSHGWRDMRLSWPARKLVCGLYRCDYIAPVPR